MIDVPSKPITIQVTSKQSNSGSGGNNDSLTIYLNPFRRQNSGSTAFTASNIRELRLWIRLLWLYTGIQENFVPPNPAWCATMRLSANNANELDYWYHSLGRNNTGVDPDQLIKCLPNFIELRNKPVKPAKVREEGLISGAPLLKTSSAVGILKVATQTPNPKIEFVSPDKFREIAGNRWNQAADVYPFYTLLPEEENEGDESVPPNSKAYSDKLDQLITRYIEGGNDLLLYDEPCTVDDYYYRNTRLGVLRRYLLIIKGDQAPSNAYVSYLDQGQWYYIDGDDHISQKNFDLITLFLTMMAVPAALPPISPTISVGGGGGGGVVFDQLDEFRRIVDVLQQGAPRRCRTSDRTAAAALIMAIELAGIRRSAA
jgi:hypothetical protein